jgi:hypothetical protein
VISLPPWRAALGVAVGAAPPDTVATLSSGPRGQTRSSGAGANSSTGGSGRDGIIGGSGETFG